MDLIPNLTSLIAGLLCKILMLDVLYPYQQKPLDNDKQPQKQLTLKVSGEKYHN